MDAPVTIAVNQLRRTDCGYSILYEHTTLRLVLRYIVKPSPDLCDVDPYCHLKAGAACTPHT